MQPKQKKKKLCAVHEKIPVNNQMCQVFFEVFKLEFFSLKNTIQSGRSGELNNNQIKT